MKIHQCLSESRIKSSGLPPGLGYLGQQCLSLYNSLAGEPHETGGTSETDVGSKSEVRSVRNVEPRMSNVASRLVHLVCLVHLVFWLNETNQMNQINQINKTNQTNQIDETDRTDHMNKTT